MSRNTKYTDSTVEITRQYIDSCSRESTELPTIEGIALVLGVNDETIGIWAKKYPEFDEVIKDLKAKQKTQLMNDGLYGGKEINSTMAIFLLKVNHGMIETEKKILAGEIDNPIKIDVGLALDKIYGTDKPTSPTKMSTNS